MKIHITNIYNFNKDDQLVQCQQKFADAGRSLGFYGMGIFSYPVETDSPSELSKRLDGVIAALESEDVVIMQLPTFNGIKYEQLLFSKIKAYKNTKIVLLFHNTDMCLGQEGNKTYTEYMNLCKRADQVILLSAADRGRFLKEGISNLLICDDISIYNNSFYFKKLLLDAVDKGFEIERKTAKMMLREVEDEIQVGFGLHDKSGSYSMWVGVTMQSIIEHTKSKVCFHILVDDTVSQDNKNKLVEVAAVGGQRIKFHNVDKALFTDIANRMERYTIGAMFRVLLPEMLLGISKIIYLDADLLFNRDIKELWDMNIEDYSLIAAYDAGQGDGDLAPIVVKRGEIDSKRYFNTGVLYMNLDKIRINGNMREKVVNYFANTPESLFPDQDALNALYNKETLVLDTTWNYLSQWVRNKKEKLEEKVYHYAASVLQLCSRSEMDQLYFETINHTPWGNEVGSKILVNSIERMHDRLRLLEDICMQVSGTKKIRVFYGEETKAMRNMYKLLDIQEGDYRVLTEAKDNCNSILSCKELSILHKETNEHIIFVLPQADNWRAVNNLVQMGYTEGKDFFIIPKILDAARGGYV